MATQDAILQIQSTLQNQIAGDLQAPLWVGTTLALLSLLCVACLLQITQKSNTRKIICVLSILIPAVLITTHTTKNDLKTIQKVAAETAKKNTIFLVQCRLAGQELVPHTNPENRVEFHTPSYPQQKTYPLPDIEATKILFLLQRTPEPAKQPASRHFQA